MGCAHKKGVLGTGQKKSGGGGGLRNGQNSEKGVVLRTGLVRRKKIL